MSWLNWSIRVAGDVTLRPHKHLVTTVPLQCPQHDRCTSCFGFGRMKHRNGRWRVLRGDVQGYSTVRVVRRGSCAEELPVWAFRGSRVRIWPVGCECYLEGALSFQ